MTGTNGGEGPERPSVPMSPWRLLELVERRVWRDRGARLTPDSCRIVLDALRAYVTNPRRDRIATIICCRIHVRRVPCQPLCRRCLETAFEIKQEINGVPDWFGDRGRHDGGGR